MNSNARITRAVSCLLPLAFMHTGAAQTMDSNTTTEANADDEIYYLEAFQVDTTKDYGYLAVDSLAGGRVNTPLKLTPATVSSITSAFMQDLGLTDVRKALQWTANVVPETATAGKTGNAAFHDWAFNYRGSGAGQQGGPGPTRNYFSFYQNPDTYNVDRIEFLRGPNSLVFGLGTVGGTLTVYSKRPHLDDSLTTVTGRVNSNGGNRIELDTNQVLGEKAAIRVNTVADNFKGWSENDNGHFRAATVALQYKPFESTWITIEGEMATKHRTLFGYTLAEEVSGWDGVTASESWGAAPTGGTARTQAIQNAGAWGDWLSNFPVLIDGKIMHWAGGYASTNGMSDMWSNLNYQPVKGWYPDHVRKVGETTMQSTANVPVLPSSDWTYGNGLSDIRYRDLTISVDQRINDNMDLTLGGYYYKDNNTAQCYEGSGGAAIDINKQLPDGSVNPHFGEAFADFYLSKQTQKRSVAEMRAQLNYHFDADLGFTDLKQLFSASGAYKRQTISARQYLGLTIDTDTLTNVNDWSQYMVWAREYLSNPNAALKIPSSVYWEQNPAGYWYDFDDTFKLKDVAFFSNTRLFNDSLSILAGVRHDSYDEKLLEQRKDANQTDRLSKESDSGTTYSVGSVYYFHWLGAFVNYSENLQPPAAGTQSMLDGTRPGPERGKGLEYGLRISTEDHRYYASITRYVTKSTNHAVENPVNLRGIWSTVFNAHPELTRDSSLVDLAYSDTTALDVKGWEYEVTANPTDRIRIQASFAKPHTSIGDYYPNARKYVAQHMDEWLAYKASADTTEHANAIQTSIDGVQNTLNQTVAGAMQAGMVRYTANLFALYSFIDGDPLAGFSIGGGITKTGRSYAGVYEGEEYWGSNITTFSAVASYKTKILGKETRFALNVDNLLNNKDPIVTGYNYNYVDEKGVHIKDGYYMREPRTFTFTATVTF